MKNISSLIAFCFSIIMTAVCVSNSGCIKFCEPIPSSIDSTINPIDTSSNNDSTNNPVDSTGIPIDSTENPKDSFPKLDSVQSTIFGEWLGTYYDLNYQNPQYYQMIIKEDFTMTFTSKTSGYTNEGDGTWKLIGTKFTATLTTKSGNPGDIGVEQSLEADYDGHTQTFNNGSWVNTTGYTNNGFFEMKKIP